MKYTYLFPFEKIHQGARIIIYGAGDVGQEYLQQVQITRYCEVVAFVDRAYEKYPVMIIPVVNPKSIRELNFDYVVIAMKSSVHLPDIKKLLRSEGVLDRQIVFIGTRNVNYNIVVGDACDNIHGQLACEKAHLSIALKYGPGLGDAVIKKRFFNEIVKMAPEACIDIYAPGSAEFINSIYTDVPNFNLAINDGGAVYAQRCKDYALSMSIFFMIDIDNFEYEKVRTINASFAEKMKTHQARHIAYGLSPFPAPQNYIHFSRSIFKGRNCYTLYNYTNVFEIKDQDVYIPLDESYHDDFKNMKLGKYITVNYGNGAARRNSENVISKQWPKEYFEVFISLFRKKYSCIKIVQLGDKRTESLVGVDNCLLGEKWEIVKYVLKNTLLHIDIEGGLMHLATQLGTKCVAIYGPTQVGLFSYPQNINIVSEKCRDCYPLYQDFYKCAKELDKPECMWSIKPERVFKEVDDYLKGLEK